MRSISLLLLVGAAIAAFVTGQASSSEDLSVAGGRIEIKNAKVKLRNGQADAGGVVVWLSSQSSASARTESRSRVRMEQRNKRFVPHVTAVQVGTEVDFPNNDPFFHNVFSTFEGRIFDLGLYANGESRPVKFNRPGISFIFCNIHPQMSAVIVTVDTPYFATSVSDGSFSIRNVPRGGYDLQVWHERSDPVQLEAAKRIVAVDAPSVDIGVIRLDEGGYIPKVHKNKHGEDYPAEHESPAYKRP